MSYIVSPKTGRSIKIGGPAYEKLEKSQTWNSKLKNASKTSPPGSTTRGCSNVGKYPNVSSNLFCGPEGGSCPGTYPVNTKRRARAALAYARYAPNPKGIKSCVRRIKNEKGW
jgi:hypothetical protein